MLVNVARAIGPAVAGILIATVGDGVCFLVNAASFVAVVASLLTLDRTALNPTPPTPRAPGQLREGLRYVRRTPALAIPLLMMALVGCLAYEFQVSLPVMARQGLHAGATGYGFMTAAMGVGAVVGGLLVAARGKTGLRPLVRAAAAFGVASRSRRSRRASRVELVALALVGRCEHRVHVDRQLDAAARRGAEDARPRDVRCGSSPSRARPRSAARSSAG